MEEIGSPGGPEEFVGQTRRSRKKLVSDCADACIGHMERRQLASGSDRSRQRKHLKRNAESILRLNAFRMNKISCCRYPARWESTHPKVTPKTYFYNFSPQNSQIKIQKFEAANLLYNHRTLNMVFRGLWLLPPYFIPPCNSFQNFMLYEFPDIHINLWAQSGVTWRHLNVIFSLIVCELCSLDAIWPQNCSALQPQTIIIIKLAICNCSCILISSFNAIHSDWNSATWRRQIRFDQCEPSISASSSAPLQKNAAVRHIWCHQWRHYWRVTARDCSVWLLADSDEGGGAPRGAWPEQGRGSARMTGAGRRAGTRVRSIPFRGEPEPATMPPAILRRSRSDTGTI